MKKFFFLVIVILLTTSCSTNKKTTVYDAQDTTILEKPMMELNGDSDSNRAGNLKTVYFDYKSAELSIEAKNILNENFAYLKENAALDVQIEGHTDERGSSQYNLTLGDKRARSVMLYLSSRGVDAKRLTKISLGKEKPKAWGHDEESWSQNRRANFVITKK